MKEERRIARDGEPYTAEEFQGFYGEESWNIFWTSAERDDSVAKPVASTPQEWLGSELPEANKAATSVEKPGNPSVDVATLEAAMQVFATDVEELKSSSLSLIHI